MSVKQETLIDGRILILTLCRPEKLNSLTPELVDKMCGALEAAQNNMVVGAVIITGEGKAFCAGSDINARLSQSPVNDSFGGDPYLLQLRRMNNLIEHLTKPVIAAVNGHAIGGGLELALACDIRIASKSAKMGLTEAKVGAIAGAGGTQRLPRLVGTGHALEMLFTGSLISGERAAQIGLVNEAVEAEQVLKTAVDMAEKMICNAPLSLRAAKQAVYKGLSLDFESGLDLELFLANRIAGTQDRAEGMSAFLEKRPPVFRGR